MYLIFDTETTGLPQNWKAPLTDFDNWPRLVQLAWQVHDKEGRLVDVKNYIIKPEGFDIPFNASKIHGISTERATQEGVDISEVLAVFMKELEKVKFIVGHNIGFDNNIVGCEFLRKNMPNLLQSFAKIDTKNDATDFCKIPGGKGGRFKWPSLTELHQHLFGEAFAEAHNASADVEATARCFLELLRLEVIPYSKAGFSTEQFQNFQTKNPNPFELIGLNIEPYKPLDNKEKFQDSEKMINEDSEKMINEDTEKIQIQSEATFSHLHLHSQYSVLQATPNIDKLVKKAVDEKMAAVAITDHNNMFSAFKFTNAVLSHPINEGWKDSGAINLKPIVGCELNVCKDRKDKSVQDNGAQIPFLAKNKNGYHNLAKLSSLAYIEGFYYLPRVDRDLISKYKEDLIALTGSQYGVIPNLILNVGEKQAEEEFKWWQETFGDDFYIEICRHNLEEENHVNKVLIQFAQKYNVKVIASNNVYYLEKEDANAHDILLCVKDGEQQTTAIGKGRGLRFGLANDEYYFKSSAQMNELFADIPESIENITDLTNKIEPYSLKSKVLLPAFDIPKSFLDNLSKKQKEDGENIYLKHLSYKGAKQRYKEITNEIEERIELELETIAKSGYPGYFLIVQDFVAQAKKMKVSVGPGRGSAAGSIVAYCTGITNIDPLKYDLLFERFLNPERVSLPDIDIDFDDEGRGRIIDWVVNKYGKENVAQIITYGSMAAKSAIRDTARVLNLPLHEADRIAKLVPDFTSLNKLYSWDEKKLKKEVKSDQLANAQTLIKLSDGDDLVAETINQARKLEGTIRNVGTHACGVIITPEPLMDLIPIANAKDSELLVTQFDNDVVEKAGLLKMDFLGLKNLTIIKDCVKILKALRNIELDIDNIPLDDEKTLAIFQRAETKGIFQFASVGMRAHLKHLKPDKFDDLIAMNALFRPGPMEYIPNYIKRKQGKEEIEYDLPEMKEYLDSTYGITVYQEQVMLLSQKLANFTKGEADLLRKGMGKKIKSILEDLKPKFFSGCEQNGFDEQTVAKIWTDWEAFASYAFNKSHSTCYALIAYQTAYLKAHYPAELMAAILTNHMKDIKDITVYMEECKRMGLKVLGPDVNESFYKFAVNEKGEIRFGLGAIKGVGRAAVQAIVNERKENGNYISFDDFVKRVDLRAANKRTLEGIAIAGGFDLFGLYRSQYFEITKEHTFIEQMIKFGNKVQDKQNSNQVDMFGDIEEAGLQAPIPPNSSPWETMKILSKEKEVVGIYISGHPLDDYKFEIDNFCNGELSLIRNLDSIKGKDLALAGVVSKCEHKIAKNGKPYGVLYLEDYHDNNRFFIFSDDYIKFKSFFTEGWLLFVKGRVQDRPFNDGQLEFRIQDIQLLSELLDKEPRNIVLTVDLNDINEDFVNRISNSTNKNGGKHSLIIQVNNQEKKYAVELLSRNRRIDIDKEFIQEIEKITEVGLKIK
ncbi:MAG: DNA polymerase III subunit alpha [Bacteroidota bacterium]|nr:DNA polymerase III subunit alpha [Bacteroidota bacterium]